MVFTKEALSIDKEQAQKHLELLGYSRGEKIFMRYIHPNPDEGQPKSIKKPRLNWEECDRYQSQGYDAYFVVNGGGDTDAAVKAGRAIFYEHDNLPKSIQQDLWRNLGLPEPTFQVDTGGKSIHSYWVFHQPIGIKDWCELQEDLLEFADGDRSIKNPSRILRLAGCCYMKGDNPGSNIATIITASGKRYSYLELRDVIQVQKAQVISPLDSIELPVSESVPLEVCLTKRSREMLASGTTAPGKQRNDSGIELARDLIGTANYLDSLGQRYEGNPDNLFFDWCRAVALDTDKPKGQPKAIWKSASKDNPSPGSGEDGVQACIKGWHWNTNLKPSGEGLGSRRVRSGGGSSSGGTVTGDSRVGSDSHNVDLISITDTVTTVTKILKSGLPDWLEINELETVRLNSELSNKQAFYALTKGIKSQLDEVQPEDEIRLRALIDWHNTNLDFHKALPSMADDILHDAKILNIDPIGIWQYLLPAVLSMAGKRVNLDVESHTIPAIVWTAALAESGSGKTRAKKLVASPLEQLQNQAEDRYKAELAEWEETIEKWQEGDGRKPPKPVQRKYKFEVGTIQAIMRRQSEQGTNGSVWIRDELAGLFQSLGQFNHGENEALSCLAESWDGGNTHVDRVKEEDSYSIKNPRLSLVGGLQPGMFKKVFKDPNDAQGIQARFLFAVMKPQKPKRTKGFCYLSEKLPLLYQWLDALPEGSIKLSVEADRYYDKLYDAIGEQALNTSMPAIRAWMFKLPAQLLRIALGLHLIECYHDRERPLWTLHKDTLERAVLFAQYYRSTFHIVQTTAVDTDDISAILLQIYDKAITRHPGGISPRDAYREIKAIQDLAKDAGRPVGAYTADLFAKLVQMGKGTVIKNGRQIKFVASLTPPPFKDDGTDEQKRPTQPSGDSVTEAEILIKPMVLAVTENELSPVTVQNTVVVDVLQNEVFEEAEEVVAPISLEQMDSTSADESTVEDVGNCGVTGGEIPAEAIATPAPAENAPQAAEVAENEGMPQTVALNRDELIECTSKEMIRLGWSNIQGRDHLNATYKKRSRQLLTEAELLDFLRYLEKQPTPSPASETLPATEEDAQQPLANSGNVEASVEEAIAPPLAPTASTAAETPATEEDWRVGQRITVKPDGKTHQEFGECQGIIKAVKHGTCFIEFDSGESMHILFRCLRHVDEAACVNPSNGDI